MAWELQSSLEASGIEWPAWRNHIPCMAHVIQLALGSFISCLAVNGFTRSWEGHERNHQLGENERIYIGKSQRIRQEGHVQMNKMLAIKSVLVKIIWESMYFVIFWKSWNWISYTRECVLYWLRWHLLVEMCSVTVKKRHSTSGYYILCMWRYIGIRNLTSFSKPTNYKNSPVSGSRIQNSAITGNS